MTPVAEGMSRHSAPARATNSAFGILAAFQSAGPTSSVGFIASMNATSETDLDERGPLLRQWFGAARGQQHRFAAEQIARLRQVLVRMDHEHHALREHGIVVEADVARPDRTKAQPVAPPPDVRRVAIFAIALRLQHRVDGAADGTHGSAGAGGLNTG